MAVVLCAGFSGTTHAQERRYNEQVLALYEAYEAHLQVLRAGGWARVTGESTLRPGDRHPSVPALRTRLGLQADISSSALSGDMDLFDPTLADAVTAFQKRHGLEADGAVGKRTRAALNVPVAQRMRQIALNIARWDALPADFSETFLLVNLPQYQLSLYREGQVSLSMRVVVGNKKNPTPEMVQQLDRFVLNPTWYVPSKIGKRELLPKVQADPSYLDQQGMDIYREGKRLDPESLDWASIAQNGADFRFRQRPGPDNSLGRVKFLLPNPRNIYLHDTPHRALFAQSRRAQSHGCVRLEQPLELARALFAMQPEWTQQGIDRQLRSKRTVHIKLEQPVPVYLSYLTARVDNGKVSFFEDVYRRDHEPLQQPALSSALVAKLAEIRTFRRSQQRARIAENTLVALPASGR